MLSGSGGEAKATERRRRYFIMLDSVLCLVGREEGW